MKFHHIAFWTQDIKRLSDFYCQNFQGQVALEHREGNFSCQFIKLFDSLYLELMNRPDLKNSHDKNRVGHSHISIELESKQQVDEYSKNFLDKGMEFEKIKQQYNDGFYESAIFDPDGNIVELAYIDRKVNPKV